MLVRSFVRDYIKLICRFGFCQRGVHLGCGHGQAQACVRGVDVERMCSFVRGVGDYIKLIFRFGTESFLVLFGIIALCA